MMQRKIQKKIVRRLVMLGCLLALLPTCAGASTPPPAASETVLDEVVVTATPLEKYLVTTSVITDKDIAAKGARNLAEALDDVPGLNLHRGKKNANSVDIRGSALSYTKIYVDGVFINPLAKVNGADSVDLDMFPVDNIAKIEVVKGPAPVAYGTDAIGGIILITTKTGKAYPGGTLSVTGGSYGTLNGSFSYGGGDEKFNYYVNGGTEHTDGYAGNYRNSNYFNTKMSWRLHSDDVLTFNGGYSLTDKGTLNGVDPVTGRRLSSKSGFWPGLNNWEFRDWEKVSLSLDYAKRINSKWDYDVKVYRFTEKQGLWANGSSYDPQSGVTLNNKGVKTGTASSDTGYSTKRWNTSPWESALNGVELQVNGKLDAKHTMTFGMLYNDISWKKTTSIDPVNDPSNPDRLKWLDYKNKRYGYYLQDQYLANDKTTVTIGVRRDESEVVNTDNTSIKGGITNPTLNVVYQLDKRNTLRASYGETCSFPIINQLYGVYGNANLKPEKAKNYEIGFKHEFDKTMTGDIALFQNDISDRIATDPVTRVYYNLTTAQIKGVEMDLNKRFSEKWTGFVNYTYLDSKGVNPDGTESELVYTPRHHVNYGISYLPGKGYKISLSGHWIGERYTGDTGTGDNRSKVNGQTPVYAKMSCYQLLDLRLSRQVNKHFDWYIELNNIFDKQYEDTLFYPAPGRNVVLGANYKF